MNRHTYRPKFPHPVALASALTAAVLAVGCGEPRQNPSAEPATPQASTAGSELTYKSLLELLGNPDAFARARQLAELLPKLGPEAVPVVKEVLHEISTAKIEIDNADYELLIRYWARHEPGEAASYAYGFAPRGYQAGAILSSVQEWMTVDPEQALVTVKRWARDEGDFGAAVQLGLVRGWYDSGKPGLENYIHDLGDSFERQRALSAYAVAVIRKHGVDDAIRWADAVPETDAAYKRDVIRSVGDSLVPFDIEAAQRFCTDHCNGPNGTKLRTRIATRWATLGDSPAALDWLSKGEQDNETQFAVRQAYAAWGSAHREPALAWMKDKMAGGDPPDWLRPAVPVYVDWVGRDAPIEALELTAHFADTPELRDEWTVKIARHWRQQDEKAAEAWLAKSSLSQATLEKIREPQTEYERMMLEQEARAKTLHNPLAEQH